MAECPRPTGDARGRLYFRGDAAVTGIYKKRMGLLYGMPQANAISGNIAHLLTRPGGSPARRCSPKLQLSGRIEPNRVWEWHPGELGSVSSSLDCRVPSGWWRSRRSSTSKARTPSTGPLSSQVPNGSLRASRPGLQLANFRHWLCRRRWSTGRWLRDKLVNGVWMAVTFQLAEVRGTAIRLIDDLRR